MNPSMPQIKYLVLLMSFRICYRSEETQYMDFVVQFEQLLWDHHLKFKIWEPDEYIGMQEWQLYYGVVCVPVVSSCVRQCFFITSEKLKVFCYRLHISRLWNRQWWICLNICYLDMSRPGLDGWSQTSFRPLMLYWRLLCCEMWLCSLTEVLWHFRGLAASIIIK